MDDHIRPSSSKSANSTKGHSKQDVKNREVKSSNPKEKSIKDTRNHKKETNESQHPKSRTETKNHEYRVEIKNHESRHPETTNPEIKNAEKSAVKIVNDLKTYVDMRDNGLVVVDFNTSWCGPCKGFAPVFEEIAKNYPGVSFLSVDAESFEHEDTASVKSVPTFKIFLNGVLRREFSGINREKLERYIERYQIQIVVNGRTQRTFPKEMKDKVLRYMNMLQPE